jgi:hypothetical protein
MVIWLLTGEEKCTEDILRDRKYMFSIQNTCYVFFLKSAPIKHPQLLRLGKIIVH